ncbi:serine/threonine-protein kinase pim-1-like [Xyrauchen texanus]|uniref:serine/threonine-protein kinase pim-1-like n=1 Tax=Xyrauchen texanus TaxID=154827 RepID=UPI002241C072|nr:serine/threonine-protein kinase pim-1-like [Xyrauchen texanus]
MAPYISVVVIDTCCKRGMFQRDIILQNLLVNKDTTEVKCIDFGCGNHLRKFHYKKRFGCTRYLGTEEYCPPEVHFQKKYHGKTATVWSLGIMLFRMVCGHFPYGHELYKIVSWGPQEPHVFRGYNNQVNFSHINCYNIKRRLP